MPGSVTVDRLDGEAAADYFVPHDTDRPTNSRFETIVTELVGAGEVIAVEISYTDTLSVGWVKHHEAEIGARTESTNHVALKLRLAKFLDELGHDCGRWSPQIEYEPELERWETKDYLYSGFETDYPIHGRVSDFSCSCGNHAIYCEVGRTPPKKLIDADLTDSTDCLLVAPYSATASGRRDEPTDVSIAAFATTPDRLNSIVAGSETRAEMHERLAAAFDDTAAEE